MSNEKNALSDNELENVNGGMEIVIDDVPRIFRTFLRFLGVGKSKSNNTKGDGPIINGPIMAADNDGKG